MPGACSCCRALRCLADCWAACSVRDQQQATLLAFELAMHACSILTPPARLAASPAPPPASPLTVACCHTLLRQERRCAGGAA